MKHGARGALLFAGMTFVTGAVTGCASDPSARRRMEGLNEIVKQAESNGAMACAPKELAIAKSRLLFASLRLDQGGNEAVHQNLEVADVNAHAALTKSPPGHCADLPVVGDADGDGIVGPADKCPNAPETYNGFQDTDGCPDDPDTDKDGVPDSKDQCPLEPEDKDGFQDDDGCPDPDNDHDGIPDAQDKCPNEPEDPDGFQDEDGCPDDDNDGDTVKDVDDQCPNTPGSPAGERPGCSNLIIVTAREIRITQQIQFDLAKATIKPVSFPTLDAVQEVLVGNPKIALEIQGHTDNAGNASLNQKLSQDRAEAVRAYLVKKGIASDRLVSRGYGAGQPLVPNDTNDHRALNRRVQFLRTEK